ncbi:MAG: DUF4115 domain-containing protein [Pseudobdellovibrionaceae bacterium]|jgi:cytoskeletal protein RodZ|nr:DUF4115 domain-containing protein [Pseudobdellovibrionaceae bacterium]
MSAELENKKYHPKESEDLLRDFHTDLSVGDILHRARTRADITLEHAAQQTRIRISYLQAIEDGQLDRLPGRIYALGFIKTYAEFLNLDGEKIIQLLKRQSGTKVAPKPLPTTAPVEEDHSLPSPKTFIIVLIMLVCGLTIYPYAFKSGAVTKSVPSVPEDLKEQVTLLTKPQTRKPAPDLLAEERADGALGQEVTLENQEEETTEEILAEERKHPVILKALENVWLEIRTPEQKAILSRVLSKGEEYWVPEDQANLVMTLGNAGGLQILVEGQPLPLLGRKSQVVRNLSLNPDYLKEILKKAQKKSM